MATSNTRPTLDPPRSIEAYNGSHILRARNIIACRDDREHSALRSNEVRCTYLSFSMALLSDCNFANMPTTKSVPEVRMHPSMKPYRLRISVSSPCASFRLESAVGAYFESGGNVVVESSDMNECAADAIRYGKVTSMLVNASGRENHDVDAAGMLSSNGRYVEL